MSTEKWILTFNNQTGSETQASGCGPNTAVFGVHANNVDSMTKFNVSADSSNLSSITTDHILYVDINSATSTNDRKFFTIKNVYTGNSTIEVNESTSIQANSLTWAVGGKRKNPFNGGNDYSYLLTNGANTAILLDWFNIEIEPSASVYTNAQNNAIGIKAVLNDATAKNLRKKYGPVVIAGTSSTEKVELRGNSASTAHMFSLRNRFGVIFRNLKMVTNNIYASVINVVEGSSVQGEFLIMDCDFVSGAVTVSNSSSRNGFRLSSNGGPGPYFFIGCRFYGEESGDNFIHGIETNSSAGSDKSLHILECSFKDCEMAIHVSEFTDSCTILNNLIYGCGYTPATHTSNISVYANNAIIIRHSTTFNVNDRLNNIVLKNNTIIGAEKNGIFQGSLGLVESVSDRVVMSGIIMNNNIVDCGDYGFQNDILSANVAQGVIFTNNNFYNNGIGDIDTTYTRNYYIIDNISIDPNFEDPSANNYVPGVTLKNTSIPTTYVDTNTTNYESVGALNASEKEGGSAPKIIRPTIINIYAG